MTLYDTVRWILLVLLFGSLFGVWWWSRRQAKGMGPLGGANPGSSLKVLQKRWIDQKTGVALVEAEDQTFLLAYTAGSVSWQPLEKAAPKPAEPVTRLATKPLIPENGPKMTFAP